MKTSKSRSNIHTAVQAILIFLVAATVFGATFEIIKLQKQIDNLSALESSDRGSVIQTIGKVSDLQEQVAQLQAGGLPSVVVECTTKVPVGDPKLVSQIPENHLIMVVTNVPETVNLWLTVKSADWLVTRISRDDLSNPESVYIINGFATDLIDSSQHFIGQYGYIILQGWSSVDDNLTKDELVFTETIIPKECKNQ